MTELFSIPLYTGWTVFQHDRGEVLELQYRHREQKAWHRYQDYDLSLCLRPEGAGHRLTLTVAPRISRPRQLEERIVSGLEELPGALSRLQAQASPECWGAEHRVWIAGLWEEERRRLNTRHIRQVGLPRPPVPVDFVPLKIPAGWEAAWNTFDCDYLRPSFLAPAENFSKLHWERDIAMFVKGPQVSPLCLDLEDWSDEDMRTSAFRVHLYRWTEEGPETIGEEMTGDSSRALKKLEEFFLWDCETERSSL